MMDSGIWVGPKPLTLRGPTAWALRLAALVTLVVATAPSPARAQAGPTASLRGQVVDSSGMPIPLASVRIEGIGFHATSDTLGQFRLEQLPTGRHLVSVKAAGWRSLRFEITLKDSQEWIGWIGLQPAVADTPAGPRSTAPNRRSANGPRRSGPTTLIAGARAV